MTKRALDKRCVEIADTVVPQYRSDKRSYSCTGGMAKRWQAAFEGACIALGRDPKARLGTRQRFLRGLQTT